MDTHAIRILVADDNAAGRELMRTLLQMEDYVVYEARDGNEAVEMARRLRPDVVLMDVHMPVLDGIEATRLLREDPLTRSIPVIVLTASATPDERRLAVRAGCVGYLFKPVDMVRFPGQLDQWLRVDQAAVAA
ncbi:MAG: response regulator [Chloroflexi bacterium]|nr:MAG: response regulator [Chloroflexota bacterium]